MNGRKVFIVKVGVHQGSVLSHLLLVLFVYLLRNQTRLVHRAILDVDDYVLFAETKTLLLEKFSKWKRGTIERKGHKVNFEKRRL